MDFIHNKINILRQEMDGTFVLSGHYSIRISKMYETLNTFDKNKTQNFLNNNCSITTKTLIEKSKIAEKY